jgi:adenosylcobinamide-GDP ribazoletransferase
VGNSTTAISERATGLTGRIAAEVRASFALLTRLPIRSAGTDVSGASAFALVGGLVGLAGAAPLLVLGPTEPLLAAVAAVSLMAVLSGALHLDGLADTADALLAPDRARAEQARNDPAVGAGGIVALVLVLAAQVAALSSLASAGPVIAAAGCVVAGAVSRLVPVVLSWLSKDRATTGGFGGWFAARVGRVEVIAVLASAVAIVAAASVIAGSPVPALGGASGAVLGVLAGRAVVAARSQLDGDGLGASVELAMVATLAACAIAAA